MKKLLIILALLVPFCVLAQNRPLVNADLLDGFDSQFFLDTLDFDVTKTWYVDVNYDGTCWSCPVSNGTILAPFTAIQQAFDSCAVGDIVLVYPGTYPAEHLHPIIDLIDLRSVGGASQTFVALTASGGTGFDMDSEGMTIDGFYFTGDAGFLIQLEGGEDGFTLKNCIIDTEGSPSIGLNIGASGCSNMIVENNKFISETDNGAIWMEKNVTNPLIRNNWFVGADSALSYAIQTAGSTGGRYIGNLIESYASGIFLHTVTATSSGTANELIANNTIKNCSKAIRLGHTSQTVNMDSMFVFSNTLYYNSFAIWIADDAQVLSGTFEVVGNNINDNTVSIRNAGTTPVYLANWIDGALVSTGSSTFGDLTIEDATPQLSFKDTDASAGDVNASIQADATDTGNGTEDIDMTFMSQVAGAPVNYILFDADGTLEFVSTTDIVLDPSGNNVLPGSDNTDALGVTGTGWSDLFLGDGGIIDFNSGDATITHSSDLINISNANTRVDRLEVDGVNDWIDVSTDFIITAAADIELAPGGGDVFLGATDKFYYDGRGDTYEVESAADVRDTYVGGVLMRTITEATGSDNIHFLNAPVTIDSSATELGYDIINNSELQNSLVGSYYNFDEVNSNINMGSDTDLDNIFLNGGTVHCRVRILGEGNSAFPYIYTKGEKVVLFFREPSTGNWKLKFSRTFSGDDYSVVTDSEVIEEGKWYHIAVTYNSSDVANEAILYINGIAQTAVTHTVPTGTIDTDAADDFIIGDRAAGARTLYGDLAHILVDNRILSDTETKEVSMWSSDIPPVWFSDVGASQTEQTSGTLTIGKRYRINNWITNDDFTNIGGTNADGSEFIATGTTPTTWTNSSTVVLIGPVGNWNGSGIGHNTWMDVSGNDLYGTVGGAIYTNIPNSDTEEARQDGITTDTQILSSSNLVPDGYVLKYVIGTEVAGNTATLDLGTSAGGSQVFSQQVFTASTTTPVAVDFFNLTGSDVALYINDDGVGTWNSGELDFIFVLQKIR